MSDPIYDPRTEKINRDDMRTEPEERDWYAEPATDADFADEDET